MPTRVASIATSSALFVLVFAFSGCDRDKTANDSADRAELAARLDSMVATERAFSAFASETTLKDAFLRHLAPDAIGFDPLPEPARAHVLLWQPSDWVIVWEPAYAEISGAGDLGFTTGPCDIRPPASAKRDTIHGQYNSVWRRNAEGVWQVVADLGVDVSPPAALYGKSTYEPGALPRPVADEDARPREPRADLESLDRALGERTARDGIAGTVASQIAADGRVHHQGLPAARGPSAVTALLDSLEGTWHLMPAGSGISKSNDFGYTYGVLEHARAGAAASAAPDSSVYLNVWKRAEGKDWRLALAVVRPLRR
jgi:ketosteroid isomerase-like protein